MSFTESAEKYMERLTGFMLHGSAADQDRQTTCPHVAVGHLAGPGRTLRRASSAPAVATSEHPYAEIDPEQVAHYDMINFLELQNDFCKSVRP